MLTGLDQCDTSLDRFTPDLLERWLDEPANKYKPIRIFLCWATKSRYAPELTASPRRAGQASISFWRGEQRWQQLRSCLHDQNISLAVRAVGTLTLLFGVTTSRIRELTTDDVRITAD